MYCMVRVNSSLTTDTIKERLCLQYARTIPGWSFLVKLSKVELHLSYARTCVKILQLVLFLEKEISTDYEKVAVLIFFYIKRNWFNCFILDYTYYSELMTSQL